VTEFFGRLSFHARRFPLFIRLVLAVWLAAGAGYFMVNPSTEAVPVAFAVPLVLPFVSIVFALMAFNLFRLIRWLCGNEKASMPKGND
jgi:hypothetical protein